MRRLLHIITTENETRALEIIDCQRAQPDCEIEVIDLTKPEPDYRALLEAIFTADSLAVW